MKEENKWKLLGQFLALRIKKPLRHPEYIIYFGLVIIGFGAIGIYAAIFSEKIPGTRNDFIISNIASYFLAIIATGTVELIFIEEKKIKRSILLLSIAVICFNTVLFFISTTYSSYWFASFGLLIALTVWWIANAENPNIIEKTYNDEVRKEARNNHGLNWK